MYKRRNADQTFVCVYFVADALRTESDAGEAPHELPAIAAVSAVYIRYDASFESTASSTS